MEGGLAVAGFVAADLGDVDAAAVGEDLWGEGAVLAEGDEAVGEVSVGRGLASGAGKRAGRVA